LHPEVGAEPEAELASFAALPLAVLFFAQAILQTFVPVATIVERRACGARPFHGGIPQNFPRNGAFASLDSSCDLAERVVRRKHAFNGFPFVEHEMFVI
jgi:hypothetical protein